MNKKENTEHWKNLVNEFKSSGKTARAWCKENNISTSTFGYWLKKYNNVSDETLNANQWISIELENIKKEEILKNKNVLTIRIGAAAQCHQANIQ